MTAYRLAQRESPSRAIAALQLLARVLPEPGPRSVLGIAFKLRLALARLGGSEPGNTTVKEYLYAFQLLAIFLDVFFRFRHALQPLFFAQAGVAAVRQACQAVSPQL